MKLNTNVIMIGTGCDLAHAKSVLPLIQAACDEFEVNTPHRVAAFLANVGVESQNLTRLEENLNYSAQRLAVVWPFRFAEHPHVAFLQPNEIAKSIANNPKAIANSVYANRYGNGDAASDDGWTHRGSGYLQTTFKENFEKVGTIIKEDLIGNPDLLRTAPVAARAAAAQFDELGCNILADKGDIQNIIRAINGQYPCAANQGSVRIARYCNVLPLLVAIPEPEVKTKAK